MKKKTYYETPEAELIVVRFDGNFCATEIFNQGGGGQYGDDDINENDPY